MESIAKNSVENNDQKIIKIMNMALKEARDFGLTPNQARAFADSLRGNENLSEDDIFLALEHNEDYKAIIDKERNRIKNREN